MQSEATGRHDTFRAVLDAHLHDSLTALSPRGGEGMERPHERMARFLDTLGPWSLAAITDLPVRQSWVRNDGWPVELSFAFSRTGTRLGVRVEELGAEETLDSHLQAGQDLLWRLWEAREVKIARYLQIEEALFPAHLKEPQGAFMIMHGLMVPLDEGRQVHAAYLNPAIGDASAQEKVGAVMVNLGLGQAWALAEEWYSCWRREICMCSLELSDSAQVRLRVYMRHNGCDPAEIDAATALALDHEPGTFEKIIRDTYGPRMNHRDRPVMTSLEFSSGSNRPTKAVLHCPVYPNLPHDAAAATGLRSLFDQTSINTDTLERLLCTLSGPHLEQHRRISWFTFECPQNPVITISAGLRDPGNPVVCW